MNRIGISLAIFLLVVSTAVVGSATPDAPPTGPRFLQPDCKIPEKRRAAGDRRSA